MQQAEWRAFRRQMKQTSGTYSFLRGTVTDLVDRLRKDTGAVATTLAEEGDRLLREWETLNPSDGRHADVTKDLSEFTRRAVSFLIGK